MCFEKLGYTSQMLQAFISGTFWIDCLITCKLPLERICPSPQATWVKFGKNIYKDTYKYTASVAERVDDLNEMIYDENVRLVFFGGGYGSVDLLPYIDYNRIKETLKLF